jgi:hypothetical protein
MLTFIRRLWNPAAHLDAAYARLDAINVQLDTAYSRALDPLRDTDFDVYCVKYGVNRDALLIEARAKVARNDAAHKARIAARRV